MTCRERSSRENRRFSYLEKVPEDFFHGQLESGSVRILSPRLGLLRDNPREHRPQARQTDPPRPRRRALGTGGSGVPVTAAMRDETSIYRAHASAWWDGSQRFLRLLRNLVTARFAVFDGIVGSWQGRHVLDLGCGGGFMAEALAGRGATVVGVDPVAEVLAAARAHARDAGLAIDYRVGGGEAIPLAEAALKG